MKNTVITWILIIFPLGLIHAQKAETVLENAAKAYEKSNGISATVAVNLRFEKQGVNESFEGNIQMKGDKFVLMTPDTRTWYDGSTLWTYMVRTDEVNISNPTGDELQFINPMILLRSYHKGFNISYIGESTSENGRMADDVQLSSKGSGDIDKIQLQIEKATSLPVRIHVTLKNGMKSLIRISKMNMGVNQSDGFFVFKAEDYPGVLEVDLR